MVAMFQKDLARAARAADTALSLNPNYAQATGVRGVIFIYSGEPDKSIPYIERTMRLDPLFREQYLHFLATAKFVAGDYVRAAEYFRERISVNPATDLSRALLAATLGHLDQAAEAGRIWRELMEINPKYSARDHIARLPFENPEDGEKIWQGLQKAGLAD
jgi:adenylate cyclase